jgi:hypothetical protein
MLGSNMPPIGGHKVDPHDLSKMMNQINKQQAQMMQITDDKIVVCHACGCEHFSSPIRLAKTKIDFGKEVVGMVHEQSPALFCFNCRTELPRGSKDIKTKSDMNITDAEVVHE